MTSTINIRNISIKCGNCETYQILSGYSRRAEWNVYAYECENEICDPNVTRTIVEVPADLDEFARRDPDWQGHR
jgi:ribosomal protein S27E